MGQRLFVVLFLIVASTTAFAQGTFTLGSQVTTECPINFVCYNFTVDIPAIARGVNENNGILAIRRAATGHAGIVTYHSGHNGGNWWASDMNIDAPFFDQVAALDYDQVMIRWMGNGWIGAPQGAVLGFQQLGARPATVLAYVRDHLKRGDLFIVHGVSAGSVQILLAMTSYGIVPDVAIPASGPPFAKISNGCMEIGSGWNYPPGDCSMEDFTAGFVGSQVTQGPCYAHNPSWVPFWDADSVDTGGKSYYFPNTTIHFLVGSEDSPEITLRAAAMHQVFVDHGQPNLTYEVVQGMGHDLQKYQVGLDALYAVLSSALGGTPGPPPGADLSNISTRGFVGTANNVMICGLIIPGDRPKKVILRALGPSLKRPPFNVPDSLSHPVLELLDSRGRLIASNDNWRSAGNAGAIAASGYAPLNNKEPAILTSLDPGNYTAVVRGANNTTGIALLESYDLDFTSAQKFGNVSTRAFVGTAANVMIAGVIAHGPDNENVVIRGLGPTLSHFGVPNVLADPVLDLRDANGNEVMTNDNWKNNQETEIQASGYAPPNDLESAILITLAPGNYTAILSGKNKSSGNGLVEVYDLN